MFRRFSSSRVSNSFTLLGLVAFLLAASPQLASAAGMTAKDVARIESVSAVAMSPDVQHIAYTLSVPRELGTDDNGGAWSELHVCDLSGKSRPFITGEVSIGRIQWKPDGSAISFVAKRGDDKHSAIYAIPVDGGEAKKIVSHEAGIGAYDWDASGERIAFVAKEKKDKDKKDLEEKGFNPEIYEEDLNFSRVWISGTDPENDEDPRKLELDGSATAVYFSPDGKSLAVKMAKTPLIDHQYMFSKIHVVDVESGTASAVIENVGKLEAVRWCPDGKSLAFLAGEDLNDPSAGRLFTVSASGGAFKQVAPDYLPNFASIEWQNANTIMFLANDGCLTAFGRVNKDGSDFKIVVEPGGPVMGRLSLSKDGQSAAFAGSAPTHAPELFVMKHGETSPRRLTHHNEWLNDVEMAKEEIVRYKARDGETIEAILVHPLNEKPGVRYPLVLDVHGGPESQVQLGFSTRYASPGQMAAAMGIAVLRPNYRGSTGRGVAFAKAHQSDYGGKEFDDLIDGVDYLIEKGLVDKDRVGITGGSYGGFATAWCSTKHTDRFAAGVMFVGISDQISKSGTTDIAEEMYLVHARKRIWEDWQFFLERSPIYYVEQARTPLLILHGKEDPRVHPSQSMELYRNLKILGNTPVRLVLYPGEGHGNRKAASRYDYSLRMMRWMKSFLQDSAKEAPPFKIDYELEDEDDEGDDEPETPEPSDES
ncbi:MAG: prolyl oligopeptidase [Phycisphaerae bacterium]|nr:MAG: prolyl oligopeptidase [Phycisphaerae bacterium]